MVTSRLSRFEEKNAKHRIVIGLLGSVAVLLFIAFFGLKLLIGFSVLVERIKGGSSPSQSPQQSVIIPPVLDQLPEATNSATLTISGTATAKNQVIIYVNDKEYKRIPVPDSGSFQLSDIPVNEGSVTVSAKLLDTKNAVSDLSNIISTVDDRTAPKLTVDAPQDNAIVNDGTHKVLVTGKTDEDMKLTITGRIVVVKSDGSFSYNMPLNDGANKLEIVSTDAAGNSTTITKNVTYQP